jgi:uncharacterized protein YraI
MFPFNHFKLLFLWLGILLVTAALAPASAQEAGPVAVAYQEEGANVRSGPGTEYDSIGRMIRGQSAPIIGQALNGDRLWYQIVYFGGPNNTGWVWDRLVRVDGDTGLIPQAAVPPTPTLLPTATLEFGLELTATPDPNAARPPTFTPPAVVIRPTLLPVQGVTRGGGVPPALIIIILFVLGVFAGGISLLRGRG